MGLSSSGRLVNTSIPHSHGLECAHSRVVRSSMDEASRTHGGESLRNNSFLAQNCNYLSLQPSNGQVNVTLAMFTPTFATGVCEIVLVPLPKITLSSTGVFFTRSVH